MKTLFLALAITLSLLPAHTKTAVQFLQDAGAPIAAPGHTLDPLTWSLGGQFGEALQQELSRWGYAVFIDGAKVLTPTSSSYRLAQWAKAHDAPVFCYLTRPSLDCPELVPESIWCHDAAGARLPRFKPYLRDTEYAALAELSLPNLRNVVASGARLGMVIYAGEDEITTPDHGAAVWKSDPTVAAAIAKQLPGDLINFYGSAKGRQVAAVLAAVQHTTSAPLVYYGTGITTAGWYNERQQIGSGWTYRHLRWGSSRPSFELYYSAAGNGTFTSTPRNLLRCATNVAGQLDGRLAYHWINGGQFDNPLNNAPDDLFRGYLRCCYTLGMTGVAHGYCKTPPGGFNNDLGATVPNWLRQMMTIAQVHAEFSYLEDYLRTGELLYGDTWHVWNANGIQPSYEFTTGDPTAHVIARQKPDGKTLICAWVADGLNRPVTVTIPKLGTITITATREAALYQLP